MRASKLRLIVAAVGLALVAGFVALALVEVPVRQAPVVVEVEIEALHEPA